MDCGSLYYQTGSLIIKYCYRTTNRWERIRGILGRGKLSSDSALYINNCDCIHTFFLKTHISAIFLDNENRILEIVNDMKPWRLRFQNNASSAIIVNPEKLKVMNLRKGYLVNWRFDKHLW